MPEGAASSGSDGTRKNDLAAKDLRPLSTMDNGRQEVGDAGLEPATPSLSS